MSVFLFCVGPALPVPQLLEHETKAKCDKAKAAPASTSGTLGPSTTGHGPGMPIDVDGPADATTAALAAALDAALAATATLHGEEPHSTAYSSGDCAIAIEWYERVEGGLDRRAFIPGDGVVCLVNSTELRRIVALGGDMGSTPNPVKGCLLQLGTTAELARFSMKLGAQIHKERRK